MKNFWKSWSVIAIIVLIPAVAWGQGSDVWNKMREKFPTEAAVYVQRSELLNLVLEGDSIKAWNELSQDILLLKDFAGSSPDRRIYGHGFCEITDVKAKTLVWDRNRYREMNVSGFKKNDSQSSGVFYDDSYYISFNFPAIAAANRTQLQYRENYRDVRFITGYLMQGSLPHAVSTFTIKASKGINLAYKVLNDTENKVSFKKTEKGGFVFYEWTAKDLPALKNERGAPSSFYYAPYIECHIKSYETKSGTKNVLSSLDDLHRWYNSFVKDINHNPSPELIAIAKELKEKSTSELDIVRNVFYWVQTNIQYIAFEQGMRGFIPHPGSYVCEKRYGDCKDMANLIVSLLELTGVKAYHTWIGTRDLPYRYSELPTPLVDNHMIATYISNDGKYYFLDGTGNHTTLGFPSSMIQGKEAFINFGPDKYEVKVVPEMAAEESPVNEQVDLTIHGKTLVGRGNMAYSGYAKTFAGYKFDRVNQDDVRKSVEGLTNKGTNKYKLINYEIQDVANRDVPTVVKYNFELPDYVQAIGDELYINLNLDADLTNEQVPADRVAPLEEDYKYELHDRFELSIGDGFKVEYLPPNMSWKTDVLSFDIQYAEQSGKVVYTKTVKMNSLLMWPTQFAQWNDANKRLTEAYKESIVLKKK